MPQVYLTPKMRRELEKRKRESEKSKNKSDTSKVIEDKSNTSQSVGDEDTITVETNLVTIPVSVFDRNGLYIPNFQKSNFKIFENGKEQEIEYLATSDKPFTVILLLDTRLRPNIKSKKFRMLQSPLLIN